VLLRIRGRIVKAHAARGDEVVNDLLVLLLTLLLRPRRDGRAEHEREGRERRDCFKAHLKPSDLESAVHLSARKSYL
jgi:hypothetical protein